MLHVYEQIVCKIINSKAKENQTHCCSIASEQYCGLMEWIKSGSWFNIQRFCNKLDLKIHMHISPSSACEKFCINNIEVLKIITEILCFKFLHKFCEMEFFFEMADIF